MNVFGVDIEISAIALGVMTGLTYGVLAMGLVIVYRSSGVVNFAHAQIGWFAATVLGVAVTQWHLPYLIALVIALIVAAGIGAGTEVAVIRRLRNAPAMMSMVATLGVAQFLLAMTSVFSPDWSQSSSFPKPPFVPEFSIGVLRVTRPYSAMLIFTPFVLLGTTWFLRRSRYGMAILGVAANRDAARAAGISASRMSALAWALTGVLSAYVAILVVPTQPLVTAAFGPRLLLRALTAAVVGRMTSLPMAMLGGLLIGVAEQICLWNYPRGGPTDLVIFVAILGLLLFRRERRGRDDEEKGRSYRAVEAWRPLPDFVQAVPAVARIGWGVGGIAIALALFVQVLVSNADATTLISIMGFALVGISVGIVSGLGGDLSLGQFALAGVAAAVSYKIGDAVDNFLIGFIGGAFGAAAMSVLIGLPALRIRGLMLAITTLGFATSSGSWLFAQSWMFGEGKAPGQAAIGPWILDTGKEYYFFALAVLVVGVWLARNYRAGALRRRLVALRENENGARAFAVRATWVKLQAFAFAGFIAGLGGALVGHSLTLVSPSAFPLEASITVVAMAALGGIGMLAGPILGALYLIGLPSFVSLDAAGLAATSLGWLLLVLYFPGGLAQIIQPLRDRTVHLLARRAGVEEEMNEVEAPVGDEEGSAFQLPEAAWSRPTSEAAQTSEVILRVSDVTKSFGGVHAVRGVSLEVRKGETLGIIGPNGAGKTTLFELISGFIRVDSGTVAYAGQDINGLTPDQRAQLGLIRSFQDAALFPTMTVLEAVQLAHERLEPTRFFPAIAGLRGPDQKKEQSAKALIDLLGLGAYRNKQIDELSTGTRRVVEIACLFALRPTILLADEPSSGIAQRETEALRDVLLRVKNELGTTLLVVEHDVPLIMSISDRVIAMESGRVLSEGTPEEVTNDPAVIESYLGDDAVVIERSTITTAVDALVGAGEPDRCTALTKSGERCARRAGPDGLCSQHGALVASQ